MALNYTSQILTLYGANVGNDANYQSPGNFGLPPADAGSVGVASATIGTRGSYTTIPSATAPGGVTFQTRMRLLTVATVAASGTGYAPGAVVTILGGTQPTPATLTITDTKVVAVTIVGVGSGGTPGAATLTGTTGAGTKFQATVVIQSGGTLTGAPAPVITVAGDYTTNPTVLTLEPVTATASLVGVTVSVTMGVLTTTILAAGVISTLPPSPASVSSGSGSGATFTFTYAVDSLSVTAPGVYEDASTPPTIAFSSGAATATAVLAVAGAAAVATEKLLTMVEILRSLIAEVTTPSQLRNIHEVIRNMLSTMKFGGPTSFSAANFAANAQSEALNYIAKNPTYSHQPVSQGY